MVDSESLLNEQRNQSFRTARKGIRAGFPVDLLTPFVLVIDLAVVAAAYAASGFAYGSFAGIRPSWRGGDYGLELLGATAIVGGLLCASLYRNDFYRFQELANPLPRLLRMARLWVFAFLGLMLAVFSLKVGDTLSRGAVLTFGVVGGAAVIGARLALAPLLRALVERGMIARRRVVVVGTAEELVHLPGDDEIADFGYQRLASFVLDEGSDEWSEAQDRPVISDVIRAARAMRADGIFVAVPWSELHRIRTIRAMLNPLPIAVQLLPDAVVVRVRRYRAVETGFARTFELQREPLTASERIVKRGFDLVFATVALVISSPVLLATVVAIKLDSPGPVIFRQRRRGFGGETFTIFKFRSMTVLEDGDRVRQATKDDDRVTRVGRVLRKTSLDELPQIVNVLLGHMSLVGPRPHALAHDDSYGRLLSDYAYRHHVKPGITGWAQVNGLRGETSTLDLMSERVKFDLWYINHWSAWLDLWILFRTVAEVFRRRNAY